MARKSHNKRHRGRGRRHRGGASLLNAGAYPKADMDGGKWATSVSGSPTTTASLGYKSLISHVTGGKTGMGASQAMNSYAMKGGGSRRKRHAKGTRRRRRGGADLAGLSKMMESLTGGKAAAPAAPAASGGAKVMAPAAKVMAPAASAAAKVSAHTASRIQGGGMFASFGALLKEALVPLGLLAAQQTYGKRHSKKHRSSGSHTRKHRR